MSVAIYVQNNERDREVAVASYDDRKAAEAALPMIELEQRAKAYREGRPAPIIKIKGSK